MLDVFTPGADLRLGGSAAGYTLGPRRTRFVAPEESTARAEEVGDHVMSFLARAGGGPIRRRAGFLYVCESVSPRSSLVRETALGVDLSLGTDPKSLVVGLGDRRFVTGRARENDMVFCHITRRDGEDTDEAVLIRLLDDGGGTR